jgi:ADP-ribose pyrophosphatase YjhB (NUDIX family)
MQPQPPSPPPRSRARQQRDRLWQHFYQLAYLVLRCFWFVFRPMGKGTQVAIWHDGRLLLIRNGYRRGYSLPGGGRNSGESARRAAVRELREEVGLHLSPNQLRYRGTVISTRERLRDHCAYFDAHLSTAPRIEIDGREVVEAIFVHPAAWHAYPLTRQARSYMDRFSRGSAVPSH